MKTKKYIVLLLAALALPLSWANAADYLFNNLTSNEVGGSPATISITQSGTFTLSLQVQLFAGESTASVDYWLSQFAGPSAGAFTIIGRSYTSSAFPDPSASNTDAVAAPGGNAGDNWSNSTGAPGTSDGINDALIQSRNGPDLGSTTTSGTVSGPGTFQIATFTLAVSPTAAPGTYELRTFDYAGFGINDITPGHQADIFINVVPEPATWSLMVLSGFGVVALTWLRARRKIWE